jgi:hypothetical protein
MAAAAADETRVEATIGLCKIQRHQTNRQKPARDGLVPLARCQQILCGGIAAVFDEFCRGMRRFEAAASGNSFSRGPTAD